jgi:cytosine/adenosine deaminase-related metal-dependent hydrolase
MASEGKLIYGGWLVRDWLRDGRTPITSAALYEEDGRIVALGSYGDLRKRYPLARPVGDTDYIVAPGFINAHSHGRGLTTYQMGQPDEPLETRIVEMFGRPEWGATGGTKSEQHATYDPRLDTLYSCAKQIASGITTTLHSHQYIDGPIEPYSERTRRVIGAYRESGMRCAFTLGIRDRSTFAFAEDEAFLATLGAEERSSPDLQRSSFISFADYQALLEGLALDYPDVSLQMGPWNPVFCSDELLQSISDASLSRSWRIQTHLMETRYQAQVAMLRYGRSWVVRLAEIGMLSDRFSGAHCVWFNRDDIDTMRSCGAQVVHNPGSNMRLQSGIAPIREMVAAGVHVAFGIDSLGMNDDEDVLQDLRLAHLLQATPGTDGEAIAAEVMLDMATRAGAAIVGIEGIGTLDVGNRADVILLSRSGIEGVPVDRPLAELVLKRAKPAHVRTVIVGGTILMEDGILRLLDSAQLLEELLKQKGLSRASSDVTQRLKKAVRAYLRLQ